MIRFKITHQRILVAILLLMILIFGAFEPVFFYPDVLFNLTEIIAETGIMALGMTYVITTGGIDLSVGYILQLAAIVFGATWETTASLPLAILLCILTGVFCGAVNGVIIAYGKIPALVTTLGTMYLFRGLSMIIAGTQSYANFPQEFKAFASTDIWGVIPIQFFYLVFLFIILDIYYRRGSLGRILKGIGHNEYALIYSGVPTKKYLIFSYMLLGMLCSLAALIYLGRLSAAKTSIGNNLNLQVITAVVLGGTSVMGGIGSIRGTFIGVLIIGVLQKGYSLLNFSGNIYNFTLGIILITSLLVFGLQEKNKNG